MHNNAGGQDCSSVDPIDKVGDGGESVRDSLLLLFSGREAKLSLH